MLKYDKYMLYFIILFFSFIIIYNILFNSNNDKQVYKVITYKDILDTTFIEFSKRGRGAILINDSLSLDVLANLVENKSNYSDWDKSIPIVKFDNKPYNLTISDVPFPYLIFKKEHSDTLEVFKDTFKLKFEIQKTKKENN